MLHLYFLRGDTLNPAVIAEGILFKDQVAPFNIQRIAFQHQLLALGGEQPRFMRGSHNKQGRNQHRDEQNNGDLAMAYQVSADYPGKL